MESNTEIVEQAISEVAKNHGIVISADDPVLATVCLQEHLFKSYMQKIEKASEGISEGISQSIEDTTQKYSQISKDLANQVVGEALNRTSELVDKSVGEIDHKINQMIEAKVQHFQRIQSILIACTGLSAISALAMAGLVIL